MSMQRRLPVGLLEKKKLARSKLHSKYCHKYGMFTCHKSISIYCICLRVDYLCTSVANIFMILFSHQNSTCLPISAKIWHTLGERETGRENYASWSHGAAWCVYGRVTTLSICMPMDHINDIRTVANAPHRVSQSNPITFLSFHFSQ